MRHKAYSDLLWKSRDVAGDARVSADGMPSWVYVYLYELNRSVDFSSIFITEVLINEKVSLKEKQDAIQDYKEVGVARRNRT